MYTKYEWSDSMFCEKCGANLPDGTRFCDSCGAPQSVNAAAAPVYTGVREPVLTKSGFLSSDKADATTKLLSKIAWGLLAVCVLVLALSLNATLNGPVHKIPLFSMVMGQDFDDNIDKMLDEAEDELDKLEDRLDDLDGSEKKQAKKAIKAAEELIEDFSLLNVRKFYNLIEYDQEANLGFSVFVGIATGMCLFAALLLVLGGVLRNTVLVVVSVFPAILMTTIFSGALYTVLILVTFITLAVICGKINGAYKTYKKAASAPAYR